MTPDDVARAVNAELVRQGHPMIFPTEIQKQLSFNSLTHYAYLTGRPLEVCIADVVRFQIQGEQLERLRA